MLADLSMNPEAIASLQPNQLKHYSFGINYDWDSITHVVRGAVGAKKDLFILEHIEFPVYTTSSELVQFIKSYKHRHYIYTNLYTPLKKEIGGKCYQYSEELVEELGIFYENMRKDNRVNIAKGLELPSKDINFVLCLKFLLKGMLYKLVGSSGGISLTKNLNDEVNVSTQYQQQAPWGF